MARPRTPIGTFGEIEFTNLPNGIVRARVRFRDYDGQVRRVEASDSTRKLAEHRLKEKLAQRSGPSSGTGELTADSSFTRLVEVWLGDLDLEGKIALSTRALCERNMHQVHAATQMARNCPAGSGAGQTAWRPTCLRDGQYGG